MDNIGILRNIEDSELELILSWRNDPLIRKNMYNTNVISLDEHLKWWEGIKISPHYKYFMYEISDKAEGVVAFTNIDSINLHSFWAFYSSPKAPRGVGAKMEYRALEYAFEKLNLNKLSCEVLDYNISVVNLHKKFGFVQEGLFRDHHLYDNEYHDIYRLGIMKSEWEEKKLEMFKRIQR
ncbi:UDP-4-amino-4,6-dideoxy-N-acetyl-beta-L-altrosamine N-acetyltransferase [Pectobacterium parvum]|uniref:UDP-4-amino-4, 6-dideoxy-N-acetyl-beta-L-altrosamine N-acetyltransferase n=1 Tax=Pectobacterium parvum TaxID=2778550 RepID=UPI003015B8F9